jgi:hypothetical protein
MAEAHEQPRAAGHGPLPPSARTFGKVTGRARDLAKRVGEPARDRRVLSLLPQRDDDELVARVVLYAHVHEVGALEVPDVDRAAAGLGDATDLVRAAHTAGDLRPGVEHAAHALEVALDGVIGDDGNKALARARECE